MPVSKIQTTKYTNTDMWSILSQWLIYIDYFIMGAKSQETLGLNDGAKMKPIVITVCDL